jgi:PAS domain S-box-containing protein
MRPRASRGWERLFWTVFDRSSNAMALLTEQRRFAEVNPAMEELLGYPRDELVGQPFAQVLPPSVEPIAEAAWQRFLDEGTASGDQEVLTAGGERVKLEYAAHTELVTGRRLILVVAIHAEIEELPGMPNGTSQNGSTLTPREREVVELIAMGLSNDEIADELSLAPETVRTHVYNARVKTGALNRAHLVAIALAQGIVHVPSEA